MQEECDCSALPRICGEGWSIALVTVKKYVIGEVCFDKDNIIHGTKICLVNPSRGFCILFKRILHIIWRLLHCLPCIFSKSHCGAKHAVLKMVDKNQCSPHWGGQIISCSRMAKHHYCHWRGLNWDLMGLYLIVINITTIIVTKAFVNCCALDRFIQD